MNTPYRRHLLGTMLVPRLFGHGMERIDGQHTQAAPATRTKRQALCHRAGGAQPSEGAWPPAEGQCVQRSQIQARLGQQSLDGRQQPVRSLCAARAGVLPHRAAALHGDGQGFGAGIEGEQVHGPVRRGSGHYRQTFRRPES